MFTDDDRRQLYNSLEATIGQREATILMGHLPPVGWADLATKGDIAELRGRIDSLWAKMVVTHIASMIGVATLVLAAVAIAD